MARHPEYDRNAVLDAAMRVFWHQGYEATSVRDLVDACGLSTRSMYDAFGDKEHFFEAALQHYHQQVLEPVLELFAEHRGLAALRAFVERLATRSWQDGCLYLNTSVERPAVGAAAVRQVDDYAAALRVLIRTKLLEARADGEFGGDPGVRTAQLALSVSGFLVALRSGVAAPDAAVGLRAVLADIERD